MKNIKSAVLELGETFIVSLVVILTLYAFIASVEVVWGASMEPNFHTGERILVEKVTKNFEKFERGDVIVFIPPGSEDKHYIKRIIGLPGEYFKILDCGVYISKDGEKFVLQEDYLRKDTCTGGGTSIKDGRTQKIPDDSYVALGDNREYSVDSRYLGVISKNSIIGKVVFVFWPPKDLGFVN